jgi:uncharacterized protein YjbI with pentapeptide repeats
MGKFLKKYWERKELEIRLEVDNELAEEAKKRGQPAKAVGFDHANFAGWDLHGKFFFRADFTGSYLNNALLYDAMLIDAKFTGADLTGALLTNADLTRADLRRAILNGAKLKGAKLDGANLTGISYNKRTVWPKGFTPPPSS